MSVVLCGVRIETTRQDRRRGWQEGGHLEKRETKQNSSERFHGVSLS